MLLNLKKLTITTLIGSSVFGLGITVYTLMQSTTYTWIHFFGQLWLLIIVHAGLLYLWHRHWQQLALRTRISLILWGSIVAWYWLIAPLYYSLVMNVDTLQLKWTAMAFLWEVPILGALFVGLTRWHFQPLHRFLTQRSLSTTPEKMYHLTLEFPIVVGLLIFLITYLGYTIGALQLRLLAFWPLTEQLKNLANGFVISLFIAIFFYLVLDWLLHPTRLDLENHTSLVEPPKRKIKTKVLVTTLITSIGGFALIGLFVFQSYQIIINEQLSDRLNIALNELVHQFNQETPAALNLSSIHLGPKGFAYLLPADSPPDERFAPETYTYILQHQQGTLIDLKHHAKVINFTLLPGRNVKLITIAYPSDFYYPIKRIVPLIIIAGVFVIAITSGIITVYSYFITISINQLIYRVRQSRQSHKKINPESLLIGSADEVEELSKAIAAYVQVDQELEKRKDEFISLAAHQLRTPAGIIKWSLERLIAGKEGRLEKPPAKAVQKTYQANERMILLINNLLEISRIEQHRVVDQPVKIDLEKFIKKIVRDHQSLIDPDRLSLIIDIESNLPGITLDPNQLTAVIQNLLVNAVKYTPKGSITIQASQADGFIKLVIADTGIGIPKNTRPGIFQKFFRAKNAVKVDPKGSGLGLHIVKSYVDSWGGSITFTSAVNQGTTFEIHIPIPPTKSLLNSNIRKSNNE